MGRRLDRPLRGRHPRRRHDQFPRRDPQPRLRRTPARRRTLQARRCEDADVPRHRGRSRDLGDVVDGGVAVPRDRHPAVRGGLSRGQLLDGEHATRSPGRRAALIALVLGGAALRFVPIWFGLPFDRARPDEETALGHALAIVAGDANPHFFHWPSLTFYLFAAGLAAAPHASVDAQFLIARGIVAAAGTATIAVLYALVRDSADDATALVAAGLLAVAPLHVRESHFAMTDVVMTLLLTVALAIYVRARERPAWCAAAGAAALAVLALPPYRPRAMAAIAGACVVGFLAGTPYALLDGRSFLGGFGFDVAHLSGGQAFVDVGRGWSYHLW